MLQSTFVTADALAQDLPLLLRPDTGFQIDPARMENSALMQIVSALAFVGGKHALQFGCKAQSLAGNERQSLAQIPVVNAFCRLPVTLGRIVTRRDQIM